MIASKAFIESDIKVEAFLLLAYIVLYFVSYYLEYVVNNRVNLNDKQIKTTEIVLFVAKIYNNKFIKKIARPFLIGVTVAISFLCLAFLVFPLNEDINIATISLFIIFLGILINILRKYITLGLVISRVEEYLKDLSHN